ncbi:hypothetical protein HB162lentus_01360 [Mammaliicoccus lentus]
MKKVNHTLTDQEILTMRRAILNKNGGYDKVFIPNHLIEYLVSENKTLNWKGQVLLGYIGVLITFKHAYETYRKYHMNYENIALFMGLNPTNSKVSSALGKNSYLAKEKYITHINDMPARYNFSKEIQKDGTEKYFPNYNMASSMTKKEREFIFHNMQNRQLRSIEPTRQIHGLKRKRGRGIQVIEQPYDLQISNHMTFSYRTIASVVRGDMTYTEFYILALLKLYTRNGWKTKGKGMRTNYKYICEFTGISEITIKKSFKKFKEIFKNEKDKFEYVVERQNVKGDIITKCYLKMDQNKL